MSFMFRVWLIWLSVALLLLALLSQQALAVVTHNVTFTVKNNGTVVASSDIGTFDSTGKTLTIRQAEIPAEMRNMTQLPWLFTKQSYQLWPVGRDINSTNTVSGYSLPMSYRVKRLNASAVVAYGAYNRKNCMSEVGGYVELNILTDGKPLSTTCESVQATSYTSSDREVTFNALHIEFVFRENLPSLTELKIPAGVYDFPVVRTTFQHLLQERGTGAWKANPVHWDMKIKVVVEPSIAVIDMPASLPLDVTMTAGNRLVGKGAVTATISGALGRYLKIEPRSSTGGKLIKGAERIPYTLSVTPLTGDNKPRLLIDGNGTGAQPPVTIETFARRDQYRLRFDAGFSTTTTGLSSGRFSDDVTLIFTTPDLP
ncbi:hypothetical protein [Aeromonas sp. SG16]|uniref:hypothetical protein n=1 Tax=Aeromonas sp. SG16 TaxID=2950548 RepID=UPI00210EF45B|nr:hypothetical protein [Aeromonas sp. SG16]MCQ4054433.1 hypothetical protein [Aeromonas sp. SG16]